MRIQLSLDSILAPPTFKLNDNGGAYQHGKPYSTEKKVDVANTYFDMKFSSCGPDPDRAFFSKPEAGCQFWLLVGVRARAMARLAVIVF